jgi:hypothetical protein
VVRLRVDDDGKKAMRWALPLAFVECRGATRSARHTGKCFRRTATAAEKREQLGAKGLESWAAAEAECRLRVRSG